MYGLECDFSGTVTTSRPYHAPAPPLAAPSTPSVAPPARPSNFIPPTLKQTDPSVAAALREITERLRTIETGLEADRRAGRRAYPSASTAADVESAFARASSAGDHRQAHANHTINSNVEMPAESNPLQVLEQTIEKIEAMSVETSPPDWRGEDTADGASPDANKGKEAALPCPPPDAIVRNLVSIADCEAAFAL